VIDGVYNIAPNGAAVFHPVPEPTEEEVTAVAERVYREAVRKLEAGGRRRWRRAHGAFDPPDEGTMEL
jgi:hypothetical protein